MSYRSLLPLVLLAYLAMPLRRRSRTSSGRGGVLVVQTGKIGDLVCTTPYLRALKRTWPGARVGAAVIALAAPVLARNPFVDDLWKLDEIKSAKEALALAREIREKGYEWALVLMPSPLGVLVASLARIPHICITVVANDARFTRLLYGLATHRVAYTLYTSGAAHYCRMLNRIGAVNCDEPREVFPDDAAHAKAREFLIRHVKPSDVVAGISVSAGKHNKEWLPERFAAIADLLVKEYGAIIVWIGSKNDDPLLRSCASLMRTQGKSVFSAGHFSLSELSALLARLTLFVSVDNGPLYIADAMGVPVVDIAGPANIRAQGPVGKYVIVQAPGIPPRLTLMAAPNSPEREPAASAITVEMVWEGIRKLIADHNLMPVHSTSTPAGA